MILLGELSLWVALLMAAWGATVSFAGGWLDREDLARSGRRALYATFAFVLLAALGLWSALLASDFSFLYVASHTSANLPTIYKVTALWAGQSGSLLFCTLILTFYSAITVYTGRRSNRALLPFLTGTLSAVTLFFMLVLFVGGNPYERMDFIPPDGRGMNPQLQSPGMVVHPPNLYLGYIAATISFAYAMAALITRRLDAEWLSAVRRWSLLSWCFLTIGIVLGMWWAYVENGWGGSWAWHPVENASLLPWLTGTALLHSIIVQEKRGMLRKWNVTLVVSTFLLAILGAFITRSRVASSVHSFAQSHVEYWFAGFLLLAIAVAAYLVSTRLDDLRARATLESMVSREASIVLNNLVLVGIAFSVLWGTLFPLLSEAARAEKVTIGPPFFRQVNIPLGLLLLALSGIGPLLAWRRGSVENLARQLTGPVIGGILTGSLLLALGMRDAYALIAYTLAGFVMATVVQEFAKGMGARRRMYGEGPATALVRLIGRNRRRYGGYIVHVGIAVLFAAFAGLAFRKEYHVTLKAGESLSAVDPFGKRWTFTSDGVYSDRVLNRYVTGISLRATPESGRPRLVRSERRQHFDMQGQPSFEPSTEAGILTRARQDVYLVLVGVTGALGETAEIRITFNPLVVWVWVGGIIMVLGGLVVMWPRAQRREAPVASEPVDATPEGLARLDELVRSHAP